MKRLKCTVGEYGVIVNRKGEFLILQLPLSKEFPNEAWMLPGGRLTVDDEPEFGLRREVLEETGLKIKVVAPIHVAKWGREKSPKYAVFFLCRLIGKQEVRISREHVQSSWVSFDGMDKIPWHNSNSKIAVKKARMLLAKK